MANMFCYQCQEAIDNKGCTKVGACGKLPKVAQSFDSLKYAVKLLSKKTFEYEASDELINDIDIFIMNTLFKCVTNTNFDDEKLSQEIDVANNLFKKLIGKCIDFDTYTKQGNALITPNEDIRSARETILYGLMGMCAYHCHAYNLGKVSKEVFDFTRYALSSMLDDKLKLMDYVSIIDQTGGFGVKVLALLDEAHTSTYGNPVITKVDIGVGSRPGILISGHDLHDLEQLLIQSKDSDIDIYTHSEMLPAHYYPELKKYTHLRGNYGGAWHTQKSDFESFNGPIVFTTNCLVPPAKNSGYDDRVYMTGNTGMPNWKRIKTDENGKKDFSDVIMHAKTCKPPTEIESGEIVGGFAHHQTLELADKIIDAVRSGSLKKFVVMAGCDGRNSSRKYYTDFAQKLPKDTVILTTGCAKYRYNKLNLGDIEGIPRVLDAGQCNDSYSLVVIALKLAEVFGCEVNELPIVYNIAWYEQKAVIVLLSLLHLGIKNIRVGPTIPAFFSNNVAEYLIGKYNIGTITDVETDINDLIL